MTDGDDPRHLSVPVFLAIYAVPVVFCWLLLRQGYSPSLRRAGFTYAAVITAVGIFAQVGR